MGPLFRLANSIREPGCEQVELGGVKKGRAKILEASIKVPVVQAAAATAGFLPLLAEDGAERDNA
jgi:hypothetical protein